MPRESFNRQATPDVLPGDPAGRARDAAAAPVERPAPLEVVAVMLSAGRGGLEQSLLDYCMALTSEGHRVRAVVHPAWPGIAELEREGVPYSPCRSLGEWDPLAALRLRRLLRRVRPAVVLTIGRRSGRLVRRAARGLPDLAHVAQTPNYSVAALVGLDHVLATTADIKRALIEAGHPEERITVIPNLIRVPRDVRPIERRPGEVPVIGALARFVPKKGLAVLIEALALLRDRGHRFAAHLGGGGPDAPALRRLAGERGLDDRVRFLGWVDDKRAFFEAVDVLCMPSLHEAFGIVVLEAMAHGRATVVTDAEGPRAIVTDGVDGLIVPRGDPAALADALARLLDDPALRRRIAAAGQRTVAERYALDVVGPRISTVLGDVARRQRGAAR